MRYLYSVLVVFILFCFSACKKDLLQSRSVQKIESNSDTDRLNKILFINAGDGFIVGGKWYTEALILSTKDSGNTWQRKAFPNVGQLLNGATLSPSGAVYATGFEGKLMHTLDTGSNWEFFQLRHYYFRDLAFTDAAHAVVIGGISFSDGLLQLIDSAGNVLQTDTTYFQLNQVKMISPTTGYICGFGAVIKTTDGWQTWQFLKVQGDDFMAMDIHGDEIWLVGNNGSVFHSTDAGANWARLRNGNDITLKSYHLMDIKFKDSQHGWVAGEEGALLYTDDGGHHWMQYNQFTTNMLTSIALTADGRLMVVGDNGSIYRLSLF